MGTGPTKGHHLSVDWVRLGFRSLPGPEAGPARARHLQVEDAMKPSLQLGSRPHPGALSDRQLNRLIVSVTLILLIGIPVLGIVYWFDRVVDAGPSLVERQISKLETAVRENPNTISLRLELAGAYGAAKRYPDAIAQLDAVLAASPKDKDALVSRGDFYVLVDRPTEAAADYRAVIAIAGDGEFARVDTQLHQAYYGLGSIQLKQGQAAAAIPNLLAALTINRTDADTLNLLGTAYLKSGDATKAIDPLRSAILFVPTGWGDPYSTLAEAYTALGQPDEAAWASAMVDVSAGRLEPARKRLATLIAGPAATDAYVGLGLIAETVGDKSTAIDAYGQALRRDPQNFTAQNGKARASGSTQPIGHDAGPASSASPATGGN
jgi:tetratricopeptide (TPR) repeat protein